MTRPGKHTKNDGKSPLFKGKLTISMAMFNSYVKLPEGMFPWKTSHWFRGFPMYFSFISPNINVEYPQVN